MINRLGIRKQFDVTLNLFQSWVTMAQKITNGQAWDKFKEWRKGFSKNAKVNFQQFSRQLLESCNLDLVPESERTVEEDLIKEWKRAVLNVSHCMRSCKVINERDCSNKTTTFEAEKDKVIFSFWLAYCQAGAY